LLPLPELPSLPANDSASSLASPGSKDHIATKKFDPAVSNKTPKPPLPPPLPAEDADIQLPPLPLPYLSGPEPAREAAPTSARDQSTAEATSSSSIHDSSGAAQDTLQAASPASALNPVGVTQQPNVLPALSSPLAADSQQNAANFRLVSPDMSSPVARDAFLKSFSAFGPSSFSASVGSVVQKFKAEQNELVQVLLWIGYCLVTHTMYIAPILTLRRRFSKKKRILYRNLSLQRMLLFPKSAPFPAI
jgi:hypothetical protein